MEKLIASASPAPSVWVESGSPSIRSSLQGDSDLWRNLARFGWKVSKSECQRVVVDQPANPVQRLALRNFAQKMGGELLEDAARAMQEGDHICHNEVTWYEPLTKLSHKFAGPELGATRSYPEKRNAFVGSYQFSE